jgi:hypothetical protein
VPFFFLSNTKETCWRERSFPLLILKDYTGKEFVGKLPIIWWEAAHLAA